jgi:hypothetical protein
MIDGEGDDVVLADLDVVPREAFLRDRVESQLMTSGFSGSPRIAGMSSGPRAPSRLAAMSTSTRSWSPLKIRDPAVRRQPT